MATASRAFGILAAVGGALAISTGAFAADLAVRPVYKAPPPPPVFTWTGFYVGGTVGASWTKADTSLNTVNGAQALYDPLDIPNLNAFGSPHFSQTNAIVGAKAGYNQQWGTWVLGVEGDISWFRFNPTVANAGNPFIVTFPGGGSATISSSVSTSWLATIRGRAGFAADHWLIYATGGGAFANVGYSNNYRGFSPLGSGFEFEAASASQTRVGWAAGVGADYALSQHLVLSAEYLHVDLGSISAAGLVTTGSARTGIFNFSTKLTSDILRFGAAYKF